MPLSVSIIIRTQGKRPALLRRALDSVVAQGRPLEIVLVEDGGRSLEPLVAQIILPEAVTVRYLPLNACGRSAAGNAGLREATGDLLSFLDDDDWLEPGHVSILADLLDRSIDAVAAFAFANEISVDRNGNEVSRRVVGQLPFSRAALWLHNLFPIQAMLFRRDLLERLGGFDENLQFLEDWDLWMRYSAEGEFVGTSAVTSSFQIPSERSELKKRAALHAEVLPEILKKQANLAARISFPEVRALEETLRQRLEETIGARWCLSRIWKRLTKGA